MQTFFPHCVHITILNYNRKYVCHSRKKIAHWDTVVLTFNIVNKHGNRWKCQNMPIDTVGSLREEKKHCTQFTLINTNCIQSTFIGVPHFAVWRWCKFNCFIYFAGQNCVGTYITTYHTQVYFTHHLMKFTLNVEKCRTKTKVVNQNHFFIWFYQFYCAVYPFHCR